jgi:hypothetical protein
MPERRQLPYSVSSLFAVAIFLFGACLYLLIENLFLCSSQAAAIFAALMTLSLVLIVVLGSMHAWYFWGDNEEESEESNQDKKQE